MSLNCQRSRPYEQRIALASGALMAPHILHPRCFGRQRLRETECDDESLVAERRDCRNRSIVKGQYLERMGAPFVSLGVATIDSEGWLPIRRGRQQER